MGNIYKADFQVDNGTDYDKYNFSTTADQVSYTKNGKETNVQAELNALNTGIGLIGEVTPSASATASVASGTTITPTSICSMWLVPGAYIINATAALTLPKQAQIELHVGSDDGDNLSSLIQTLPTGIQWVKNVGILTVTGTASKNIILKVRQNSGTAINCKGTFYAMRIR